MSMIDDDPGPSHSERNKGPWRERPVVILWVLSLGQLITWGLVYYTFPLFVVPMEKELGWSRDAMFGACRPACWSRASARSRSAPGSTRAMAAS
jgi:hypothetical protein